jgi:D-glycero-D-manno-heptose 1,7-bisphosphate phosphatase
MEKLYNTLFLDRDGVINKHRPNDYVKNWQEFEFLPEVHEALAILSSLFYRICIVTNQRGVGKGLMTEKSLINIHEKMTDEIIKRGGRIDKIYYCTDLSDENPNRKPNIGMALQAKKDFPGINFDESVMIGDSKSDQLFGERLGMKTILIQKTEYPKNLMESVKLLIIK